MATEDDGGVTGSIPDSNGKSGDDSSATARRERTARLRGTLAKQVSAPDPYVPDPYMTASAGSDPANSQSVAPSSADLFGQDPNLNSSAAALFGQGPSPPSSAGMFGEEPSPTVSVASMPTETHEDPIISGTPGNGAARPSFSSNASTTQSPVMPVSLQSELELRDGNGSANELFIQQAQPAQQSQPAQQAQPKQQSVTAPSNGDFFQGPGYVFGIEPGPAPQAVSAANNEIPSTSNFMSSTTGDDRHSATIPPSTAADPLMQAQAVEALNNIDQTMGACAMNLSALQKIAGEQTETLRALAESMQNQNMFEMGLNLTNMLETLTAAVEPMKAVGELVPAIDQLVSLMEAKEKRTDDKPQARPTPEVLVTSLADQLSSGQIDPWTFRCAYMAVFPAEHPADLLHRLVDLLGTQRLSGDLFRAAYDAVQAAEPAAKPGSETQTIIVPDENLIKELDDLKRQHAETIKQNIELNRSKEDLLKLNEELAKRPSEPATAVDDGKLSELSKFIEELQKRMEQKESEFTTLIAGKDQELQEAQELLNSRWEEFNARYDELQETLRKRDEMLAEKEAEVTRKDAENLQLKTQMEELRSQTQEMVADMTKQLSMAAAKPKEEPRSNPGFFDPAPNAAPAQPQPQAQPTTLFEPNPNRQSLFQPAQAAPAPAPAPQPAPLPAPQAAMAAPAPAVQPAPAPQTTSSNQAIPRPAPTTAPFLTGGSYGSGVRAQVFEVIVRQALAGAPWKEICAGPMSVNNITPEEVEDEVKRRQALLGKK